jgi:hypothetical protein
VFHLSSAARLSCAHAGSGSRFVADCSSVATSVHVPSVLVGVKPDADEAQGLRRAQRASNPNGARPVQPSNHHVNPTAFLIASSNA